MVETFFTEGLEPEDFLRDFVDYWKTVPSVATTTWREQAQDLEMWAPHREAFASSS